MGVQDIIGLLILVGVFGLGGWFLMTRAAFIKEAKSELKLKVTWPGMMEVRNTTIVVLVVTAIFAVYLYIVDKILLKLLGLILKAT